MTANPAEARAAEFDNLREEAAPDANGEVNLDVILDVPVTLSMEVGRTRIPIRNLLQLNQGSVVELDREAGEPLDVFVNGTLIAHGEVVVVNEKFAHLSEVALALGLVLVAIFALAWVVRRARGIGGRAASALDVLAEVRLGPKERAVLIRVGNEQLLIGVAPGHVNTLHVLAEPVETGVSGARGGDGLPSFRELLARSLGKS